MDFRQAFGHAAKSQRNAGKVDVQYVSNGRRRNTNNFKRLRGVVPRLLSPREKCAFYFGGHALQLSDRCGPASTASGEIFRMNSSHSSCEQSMVVSGGCDCHLHRRSHACKTLIFLLTRWSHVIALASRMKQCNMASRQNINHSHHPPPTAASQRLYLRLTSLTYSATICPRSIDPRAGAPARPRRPLLRPSSPPPWTGEHASKDCIRYYTPLQQLRSGDFAHVVVHAEPGGR
jgi:hypothetical protein